jgi:23S rRNA pseudouridine1911/1915/1917 synthase
MAQQYTVTQNTTLLPFLFETLSRKEGWSKKTVKQRLQSGAISVNAQIQTKHNHTLHAGDTLSIGTAQRADHHPHAQQPKLEIIYQDKDLIAINKPAGLLSVGTHKENKNHALALLRTQLSRGKTRGENSVRLWSVHRLDRDTSGILLFATSKEIREAVMEQWATTEKHYLAVVEGKPLVASDTITQTLRLDEKEYRMHVGAHRDAKPAITHYKCLESPETRSLLEVRIETGRQHQIRAHLAWMGHAVVGDERYGKKPFSRRDGRMGLHATRLHFVHPITKQAIDLNVDAPADFYRLIRF